MREGSEGSVGMREGSEGSVGMREGSEGRGWGKVGEVV